MVIKLPALWLLHIYHAHINMLCGSKPYINEKMHVDLARPCCVFGYCGYLHTVTGVKRVKGPHRVHKTSATLKCFSGTTISGSLGTAGSVIH